MAFSLLRYENKISVLHFSLQKCVPILSRSVRPPHLTHDSNNDLLNCCRHPTCEEAIPSKERLVFYTGLRSFEAKPIFSEHNLNSDKHKYSRFLHSGG